MYKKQSLNIVSILIIFFSVIASCTNKNKQDLTSNCDVSNTSYSTHIKPIITTYCTSQSGCHGGANIGSISLEKYDDVKNNIFDIITRINTGNMPKGNSKLDECYIERIQNWKKIGTPNN